MLHYVGFRVLWLHKPNSNTLTTDEKKEHLECLSVLLAGEYFILAFSIAQYLGNMENFQQEGEISYSRKLIVPLTMQTFLYKMVGSPLAQPLDT